MPDIRTTAAFERWLKRLRDQRGRAAILARLDRLLEGNRGDVRGIGEGVSEMRIDVGPGYRVYYTQLGDSYVMGSQAARSEAALEISRRRQVVPSGEALRRPLVRCSSLAHGSAPPEKQTRS